MTDKPIDPFDPEQIKSLNLPYWEQRHISEPPKVRPDAKEFEYDQKWLKSMVHHLGRGHRSGPKKKLCHPQQLWEYACQYFQDCQNTPWIKTELNESGELVEIPLARPFLLKEYQEFLRSKNVIFNLDKYLLNRPNKEGIRPYDNFADVLERISNIIYTQKFKGAAIGQFKGNLISVDIGSRNKEKLQTQIPQQTINLGNQEIELPDLSY